MDDVRAVMDAAGFDQAVIMGVSEGGSLASLFAATHPERCLGLILYGAFARFNSWLPTEAALQKLFDYIGTDWGTGKSLPKYAPSAADDPELRQWWGKFERLGATPGAAIALMRMNSEIDISDVLPAIHAPTLVLHRTEDVLIDVEGGRDLARLIPGARLIEQGDPEQTVRFQS
jgi:pimeloyl-ACP methyl ester carboxylesterase